MFTDYFSCYKLNNKSTPPPFHEEKNSKKLKDCKIFNVMKFFFGYLNIGVHDIQIEE